MNSAQSPLYNFTSKADNRYAQAVDSWFFMDSPIPMVSILVMYLLFVLKLGPNMMKNRKPFSINTLMLLYNFSITIANAYITFELSWVALHYPFKSFCNSSSEIESTPITLVFYRSCYYYLLSKVIELLDTVFFILRKKQNQVSILHVYHHTNMVFGVWFFVKYFKSPEQGLLIGILNSFVHVIMYAYYFLAALGPEVQKYLWWKKYLTMLQLTQFGIIISLLGSLIVMDCKVNQGLSIYMAAQTVIFVLLFLNFYHKKYILKLKGSNIKEPELQKKSTIKRD